ncbi:MAG: TonB-dependent receptor [Candidatus Gygaella obscura]|nr:TonB-dependent receptor [Candidatus Gygaella obscura]
MKKMLSIFLVIILVGFFTLNCFADDVMLLAKAAPQRELLMFTDIPIVTSVSRRAEPINKAPAAITIITEEDLENMEPRHLWDIFRRVPGMDVTTQDANSGSASPRGFNEDWTRRNQVLIDGRSVYTPLYGGTEWEYLPIHVENIKRVEIIRGPSILFGTNAFTGVINFITKDPEERQGVFLKEKQGTHGYNSHTVGYGGATENLDYSFTYGYEYDRGYGSRDGEDVNDDSANHTFTSRNKYNFDDISNLEWFLGVKDINARNQSTGSNSSFYMSDTVSFYNMLRYNTKVFDDQDFYLQFFNQYCNVNNHYSGGALASYAADGQDLWTRQFDLEMQHSFSWLDDLANFVWGAGVRHNQGDAYLFNSAGENKTDNIYRLFGNNEYQMTDKFSLTSGLMFEHNHMAGDMWSGRVAGMYSPWLDEQTFRLSYARAYRSPTMLEQSFNFQFVSSGSTVLAETRQSFDLDKEVVDAYEFGYNTRLLDKKLNLSFEAFHNEYKDLIRVVSNTVNAGLPFPLHTVTTTTSSFVQNERARSNGVEIEAKYHPLDWVEYFANYTYEDITDSYSALDTLYPKHKFNWGMRMTFPGGWKLNWENYFTDHYITKDVQDPTDAGRKIKPYIRGDVRLAKTFWDGDLEMALSGQNIYDQSHLEDVGGAAGNKIYVDIERAVFFTLTGRF